MRTLQAQKLDVSVGRGPKSWTCPYVFKGLQATDVNTSLGTAGTTGLDLAERHPSRGNCTEIEKLNCCFYEVFSKPFFVRTHQSLTLFRT